MSEHIHERRTAILDSMPSGPGVYQMLSREGKILYVGKARNLKKRVSSYFRKTGLPPRTVALMALAKDIQVTLTHTEGEALILENNLIKSEGPRFNVMLRDDKGYPYIFLSDQPYPRLTYHRGAKKGKGRYFGPYPSSGSVRESLNLLQKMFGVRPCRDNYFKNRSRPCLQYQLKRCSAPCVGRVSEATYADDVNSTVLFLEGKEKVLNDLMIQKMEQASADVDYETAAVYRDRIAALHRIQEHQYVEADGVGELDIIAVVTGQNQACVDVSTVRAGRHLGRRSYFPVSKATQEINAGDVLNAFLSQYYIDKPIPQEIHVNEPISDEELLLSALSENAGHKVSIRIPKRGAARQWMGQAIINAGEAFNRRMASRENVHQRYDALQKALGLDRQLDRIECFDISHTAGEATVASCVVFTQEGAQNSEYRRFNIDGVTPGDDYGAMKQALSRRFRRAVEGEGSIPDLLLVDGGKGQLTQAEEVIERLQIQGMLLLGIAKGEGRKASNDRLFLSGMAQPTILPENSPAMHLIQQIRDEAHRFAISGHRKQRDRKRSTSLLENIEGVGAKRRQSLLKQLGGLQEVARAGVEDLAQITGISPALAQRIYNAFHEQE